MRTQTTLECQRSYCLATSQAVPLKRRGCGLNTNTTSALHVFDGTQTHFSHEFAGERFSIVAFCHNSLEMLPAEEITKLRKLGFRLPQVRGVSSEVGGGTGSTAPDGQAPHGSHHDRTLVEACCEVNSKLSKATRCSRGCRVVPITEDTDFTSEAGVAKAIASTTGPNDSLWYSSPCTGGSLWQLVNMLRGPATGKDPSSLEAL